MNAGGTLGLRRGWRVVAGACPAGVFVVAAGSVANVVWAAAVAALQEFYRARYRPVNYVPAAPPAPCSVDILAS